MRASGSRVRVAAAAAAALLAGTAATWLTHPSEAWPQVGGAPAPVTASALALPDEPPRRTSPTASPSAGPAQDPLVQTTARDARLGAALARTLPAPARFEAESVGISMRVRPVGVARDGQMALPASPAVMGWSESGTLERLLSMPLGKGDLLTVRSGSTVRRYRVTQLTRLEKEALDLEAIFDRTGPARLHVVTCGGRFDPKIRAYEENLVVVAVPVG